jgi:hypothetical protein
MIEIDPIIKIRVLERKLASAEAAEALATKRYVETIDRANRLVADRKRAYRANMELLARMDALAGYPVRLALPAGGA